MSRISEALKSIVFLLIIIQIAPPIIRNISKQYTSLVEPQTKVGYLGMKGIFYSSSYYRKNLKKMFEDPEIKAIVLKIESGGGAAGTSEAIAHEIELLKKEYPKPIITLTENICASGAYYIAATTDHIITAPSTIVGSVGTALPYQFKVNELLDKLGIKYTSITTGAYKSTTDPFVASTPEQIKLLQGLTDSSYQNFIQHVSKQRPKLLLDQAKTWAEGKVFSGTQALQLGLIDEIGSYATAERKVKELAIIEGSIEWIKPEKSSSLLEMVTGASGPSLQKSIDQLSYIMQTSFAFCS